MDAIVNLDMRWIYRPQDKPGTDYGVDAHFEVTDGDGVETGRQLAAQVKGGPSYFRETTDDGFVNRPSDRHVRYWRSYALPVILVLVDTDKRVAYWASTDQVQQSSKGGWKLVVPRSQTLGPQAIETLSEVAVGGGTARTQARMEDRRATAELRRRVDDLEVVIANYITQLATLQSAGLSAEKVHPDVLRLSFVDLIMWGNQTSFEIGTLDVQTRSAYVAAAERLFFRESIEEHDAAKAVALLLLAEEWAKAGSVFLYAIELARKLARVDKPSILDLFAETELPRQIPLDLRIVVRTMQIAARRKHDRAVDTLLAELDAMTSIATPREGFAVTAAAFWESRATGRSVPARALRYLRAAARLRPDATGIGGGPFPSELDRTWSLMIDLTASGLSSHADLGAWLAALDEVPAAAREAFLSDELNVVTLANRFWLAESQKAAGERSWREVHNFLETIEQWSLRHGAGLFFAAARRGRVVVKGEYEHELAQSIRLATEVPVRVSDDRHAMFLLNEIAASQFLYAEQYLEAVVAFRGALAVRPAESGVLATTLLKAAQSAAAANSLDEAVTWANEAVQHATSTRDASALDVVIARAEHALALWFAGERELALDRWDDATEELLRARDDTARWRGLMVRFRWASGYLANTYRTGSSPKVDVEGRPYGEPLPGAFLIDVSQQADVFSEETQLAVLLALAAISDQRKLDSRTRRWSYSVLEVAQQHFPEWRRMVALLALPHLVADSRFGEVIELASQMAGAWESSGVHSGADLQTVALSFGVVPSTLAVARTTQSLRRGVAAALLAAMKSDNPVEAACREIGEIAFLSIEPHDHRIAALLSIRTGAAASVSESPIAMLCDIALSVLPDTPTDEALALQARAEAQLTPRLSVFPTMFRLHAIPFFRDFWIHRLAVDWDSFIDAEKLSAELKAVSDHASAPKTILQRVAYALRMA